MFSTYLKVCHCIFVVRQGCTPCNCDFEGSYNRTCDPITGQCQCRVGITGQHCDACEPYQYGFSREGCKPCDCDTIGSQDLQCDANGQCPVSPVYRIQSFMH